MTTYHEYSHLYSNKNSFEITKLVLAKDVNIFKNLIEIMRSIDLNNDFDFQIHKLGTSYINEISKFIRINPKFKIYLLF